MLRRRKPSDAAALAVDRRRREDAAERLRAVSPDLESLELTIEERPEPTAAVDCRHVRRIVVERAPAMFELPCSNHACTGGGHDVSREVVRALCARAERFEGEHTCGGARAGQPCGRVLRYRAAARYRRVEVAV
jgi:hypothetical protein